MNKSGTILLIIAIFIAVTTIWINTNLLSHKGFQLIRKDKKIDFYLSEFTLLNTQKNGDMRYFVTGKHLIHQVSNKSTTLFSPLIQASNSNGDITSLHAEKATQKKDNGPITLVGEVLVIKNNANSNESTEFRTHDLVYNPIRKELTTDAEITLISDFGKFSGIGLTSKLDEQEIRIHSNVQSEFIPARSR